MIHPLMTQLKEEERATIMRIRRDQSLGLQV